jgi:hypothetical protein
MALWQALRFLTNSVKQWLQNERAPPKRGSFDKFNDKDLRRCAALCIDAYVEGLSVRGQRRRRCLVYLANG